eukprot:c22273_g1_i1 orf=341-1297(-)
MAWSAARGSALQMKRCKDEQDEHLVLGFISPSLPSASQDHVPVNRKCHHQVIVNQKDDFANDDDLCDELSNPSEKKRRLNADQVEFLEKSFNMDLKLEPERKAFIAKKLGLLPRQVAIWFQNRRARWKNKQLEQDYEALKAKYDAAVIENKNMVKKNEAIAEENKRLHAEVAHLTGLMRDRDIARVADVMGGELARLSPVDSDSDSESGLKEEQSSGKSELASPAKSDDQSEMQDSGHSCCPTTSEEAIMAIVAQPTGEINSFIACAATKFDVECRPLSPSHEVFVSPLLFQQFVNGFHGEDLLFSWEDLSNGFTWGG